MTMFLLLCLSVFFSRAFSENPHLEAGGVDIHDATAQNFKELVQDSWTIVEFYSPICGHCRKFAPEYAKLSEYLAGVIKFVRINVDEERETAIDYGVDSVPKVYLFAPGRDHVSYPPGRRTAQKIVDWIVETQDLPVFTFKNKQSAYEFVFPPKPVYPARYFLATDVLSHTEFDTSEFSDVEIATPSIRATWIVDDASWNYTVPSLVHIPALEGEPKIYEVENDKIRERTEEDTGAKLDSTQTQKDDGLIICGNSWKTALVYFFVLAIIGVGLLPVLHCILLAAH